MIDDVITLKFIDGEELGFRYENGCIRCGKYDGSKLVSRDEMIKTLAKLEELVQYTPNNKLLDKK